MVAFEQVGCMRFCERIQGYHLQFTKEFAKGFDGVKAKVGSLPFSVSSQTIYEATDIPLGGEEWFKGMDFDWVAFQYFLKPKHRKVYGSYVPRSYLHDHYGKLLEVIQRYFTCQGRFNRVYHYHIRLLMHFIGKKAMSLPYYLFRSLCKMVDRVQIKGSQVEANVFHFSLTKLMVLKYLERREHTW